MAKGSQIGLQKGKLGNTVKYRIAGSNNKEEQGTRAYQPVVANPKTISQAVQRVKMAPAVNFYRAFKDEILDHSFQSVKYGARCHSAFMKAALNMESGYPFIAKGETILVPGEYLMSKGSIPTLTYLFNWNEQFQVNLQVPFLAVTNDDSTVASWFQDVLSAAPFLRDGDQITIALVLGKEDITAFSYVRRIIIDSQSTVEETVSVFLRDNLGMTISPTGVVTLLGAYREYDIQGAAVIASHPTISPATGAVTWERSTQSMKVNYGLPYLTTNCFSQEAYDFAIASLSAAKRSNVTSDWYLNQGKAAAQAQKIPVAPIPEDIIEVIETSVSINDGDYAPAPTAATTWNYDNVGLDTGSSVSFRMKCQEDKELSDFQLFDATDSAIFAQGVKTYVNNDHKHVQIRIAEIGTFPVGHKMVVREVLGGDKFRVLTGEITMDYPDNP